MRNAIRLGRVQGIEVRLDRSWFIIFFLVAWSLAGHYLMVSAGWSSAFRFGLALVTALLFSASVLLHELEHSVVATGTRVRVITLMLFGGVAELTREPKRALHEFLIAIAGPIVSFALAAVFGLVWLIGGRLQSTSLAAVGGWLASINLSLALFNLLPGFPLDGGRIFRSIVWGMSGNLHRATHIAAATGKTLAWGFILLGVWLIFGGNWANGLWIALIGWFLNSAALSSERRAATEDLLQGHTVREAMDVDCPHLPPRLTLDVAAEQLALPSSRRCFPVMEQERLVGLLTLPRLMAVPRASWRLTRVQEVMIPLAELRTVRPDDALDAILERMTAEDINQFPVVDNGRFAGMIAGDSLVRWLRMQSQRMARPSSKAERG